MVLLLEDLDVGALAVELQRFPFGRLVHTTLPEYSMRRLEEALGQAPQPAAPHAEPETAADLGPAAD